MKLFDRLIQDESIARHKEMVDWKRQWDYLGDHVSCQLRHTVVKEAWFDFRDKSQILIVAY